uniref:Uncharacterized protein n=1 Tax=Anguilla anguilla TaxID=7936 RepID=A0A0E9TJL5_ANGAN
MLVIPQLMCSLRNILMNLHLNKLG